MERLDIMKTYISPLLATAAVLATVSALPFTAVSAQETTSGNAEVNATYNRTLTEAKMRAEFLRQRIAQERLDREAGDDFVRLTIDQRIQQLDNRTTALNNRVTAISNDVDLTQTNFLAEITQLKTDVTNLRATMNAHIANLNTDVANLRRHLNTNVASLQAQINTINSNINTLNARTLELRNRLTALENFANYLNSRLESLRACFASGSSSCVGYRAPRVELSGDINVWGGDGGWSLNTNTYFTGLSSSTWQFCALAGATNQSRRDFRIYESGGWWYVANERDNLWFGDQEGNLIARCMRVY